MKQFKRWAAMAVAGVTLAAITGCASFEMTKPAPAQSQRIAIKVSGEDLSGWSDLPIGTYRVPDSQVIISGHQKGAEVGAMFGLLGVAIAHAANSSAGANAVKDAESSLKIKLDAPLMAEVGRLTAEAPLSEKFSTAGAGTTLTITPGLVLTYLDTSDVRPFVVLKVNLAGPDNKMIWSTRYIVSTGASRPLMGAGGWAESDGAALKANVQTSLAQGVKVMLADVASPYKRDDNSMSIAEGQFPFMKQRLQVKGYKLVEDDRYMAFIPKLGDVLVFAGVNVLDKEDSSVRDAGKDDVVLKLLEPKAASKAPKAAAPAN
ncbi:hypothetical protein AACH06_21715 [Ideonella sp. DXS29W]|uniref:Uncharacterized protein n=1 Tax=Ideonella lacteola TaxID=2984193 RepID=A0ABU9BU02_9BURK